MEGINLKNLQGVQAPKVQQNKGVSEPQVKEKDNSCAKVVLGGLAALAAIGAAAVLIKNGQASKVVKDMDVNKFKQAGNKFVKGKAFTKSGKPFNGVLHHFKKDGTKIVLKYENGLLRTSEKMIGETSNSQRIYGYDKYYKLSSIQNTKGNKIFEKTRKMGKYRIKLEDGKKQVIYDKYRKDVLIQDNYGKIYYKDGKKLYSQPNDRDSYFRKYGDDGQVLIKSKYDDFVINSENGHKLCEYNDGKLTKYNSDGSFVKNSIYEGDVIKSYNEIKEMIENEENAFREIHRELNALFKK